MVWPCVVVVLVGSALSACGGSGGSVPVAELGPRSVAALCATDVRCGTYADMASCTSSRVSGTAQVEADIALGKTVYDAAAAGICLDALAMLSCSASGSTTQLQACTDAVKGTVADGGPCVAGNQCVSSICNTASMSCPAGIACCAGTCGPTRATVAEGGDCTGAGVRCADGSFCDSTAASPVCTKLKAAGASCTLASQCARGLACVRTTGATTGTCGTYPATGQDCSNVATCDDSHDFCAQATHLCTKRIAPGGDCATEPAGCLRYARCDTTTQKCVAKSAAGSACVDSSDCLGSLQCTNGVCALEPPRPACP
jgi:hypothetical protein